MSKPQFVIATTLFVVSIFALVGSAAAYTYYPPAHLSQKACQKKYREYLSHGLHKALVTTGGRSYCTPNTTYGDAWEMPTLKAAIDDAMAGCRYAKKKNKHSGTCTIIDAK